MMVVTPHGTDYRPQLELRGILMAPQTNEVSDETQRGTVSAVRADQLPRVRLCDHNDPASGTGCSSHCKLGEPFPLFLPAGPDSDAGKPV